MASDTMAPILKKHFIVLFERALCHDGNGLHQLRRLFVKNAITRRGNVENIWHACEQLCEPPRWTTWKETKVHEIRFCRG